MEGCRTAEECRHAANDGEILSFRRFGDTSDVSKRHAGIFRGGWARRFFINIGVIDHYSVLLRKVASSCTMGLLNVILLIAICSLALSWSPKPVFHSRKSCLLSMATSNNQFSELEKKLAAKVSSQEAVMEASKVGVKGSGSKVTTSKAVKAPVVNKQSSAMSATKTENLASKKAVISSPAKPVSFRPAAVTSSPVKAAPVKPQALKVVSTQPSLSGGEYAAGIGLGLAPFLLIPVVLFNAAKKLVVAPKPLPETPVVQPKVATYTKPIGDGAKEGFSELLSNKQDEELQLTRKGVKLVIGSLAVAGGLTAALFATSLNEKPGNEVSSLEKYTISVVR